MKDRIIRLSSMLLMIWYCFSIIGFDVHTCNASGRSFIATFISGLSCDDIHPDHDCNRHHKGCCHHDGCSHHHDDFPSFNTGTCCSDDYLALTITGGSSDQKSRQIDHCDCSLCPLIPAVALHSLPSVRFMPFKYPDVGLIVPGDVQSLLNIWRI